MASAALRIVRAEDDEWSALRERLDAAAADQDPYVVRMWREALIEGAGVARHAQADPLVFPYVPFLPQPFARALDERSRALDVGCLGGFGLFDFARRRRREGRPVPRLYGLDVDGPSLALGAALAPAWAGPGGLQLERAIGEALPHRDASFDLVIARSVLQYLRIGPALDELARVVRPGGLVLIQVHAPAYYLHQIGRHAGRPLQAAYYARALLSALVFSGARRQPEHRWFKEAGMTYRCLVALCAARGLAPVWSNRDRRRPLALFARA